MKRIILINSIILFISFSKAIGQGVGYKQIDPDLLKIVSDYINNDEEINQTLIFPFLSPLLSDYIEPKHFELLQSIGFDTTSFISESDQSINYIVSNETELLNTSIDAYNNYDSLLAQLQKTSNLLPTYVEYAYNTYSKKVCYLDIPIVTQDNSYAIINYLVDCGLACGHGEVVLLQYKDGIWKRKKSLLVYLK